MVRAGIEMALQPLYTCNKIEDVPVQLSRSSQMLHELHFLKTSALNASDLPKLWVDTNTICQIILENLVTPFREGHNPQFEKPCTK
jgi:hypothetical protein